MTHQDLCTLVDYHYWARDRLLAAVEPLTAEQFARQLGGSFPSVRATLVHLLGAEWVWHSRWCGQSPSSLPEGEVPADLAGIRDRWLALERDVRSFVQGLGEDGIARRFSYTLFSGAAATSSLAQTIQHLVNHGSYHRGQITTMLRQLGAAPAGPMDLIAFYREGGA